MIAGGDSQQVRDVMQQLDRISNSLERTVSDRVWSVVQKVAVWATCGLTVLVLMNVRDIAVMQERMYTTAQAAQLERRVQPEWLRDALAENTAAMQALRTAVQGLTVRVAVLERTTFDDGEGR